MTQDRSAVVEPFVFDERQAAHLDPGTRLTIELLDPIGTRTSRPGETFYAVVKDGLESRQGVLVVPPGALVRGTVARVETGPTPMLGLDFDTVATAFGAEADLDAQLVGADVVTYLGPDELRGPAAPEHEVVLAPPGATAVPGDVAAGVDVVPGPAIFDANANELRVPAGATMVLELVGRVYP